MIQDTRNEPVLTPPERNLEAYVRARAALRMFEHGETAQAKLLLEQALQFLNA